MMLRVQGSRYPKFLMKEVMPFVARSYRVASGPENTGLGGSSLGALIAFYTAASRPDVIGRLLLESPSLWASNRQMIRESRAIERWPERIFLATGTAEAGRPDQDQSMVDDVRELAAICAARGWTKVACAWLSRRAVRTTNQHGLGDFRKRSRFYSEAIDCLTASCVPLIVMRKSARLHTSPPPSPEPKAERASISQTGRSAEACRRDKEEFLTAGYPASATE